LQTKAKITTLLKNESSNIEYLNTFIENISDCMSKMVDDKNFLFDALDDEGLCNIIIDDYQRNCLDRSLTNIYPKPERLKTNLSVPQLAMLCRMLNELKPNILDINADIDLHRFIKSNFETKNSSEKGISIDNFRQDFSKPNPNSAHFWEKHLQTMIAYVIKIKKA